jgi:hypothetical protein
VDFCADELDGGFFRDDGEGNALGGGDEFLASDVRVAAALEISAVGGVAISAFFATVVALSLAVASVAASAVFLPVMAAAWRVLTFG